MESSAKLRQQARRLSSRLLQHTAETPLNLKVDRSILQFNNLQQVIWPGDSQQQPIVKKHLLAYYATIAPLMLPHLADRPLILRRFPQGITSQSDVERHADQPVPEYLQTIEMFSDLANQNKDFYLCQNLASLLWLVNHNTIEFYPWYSRITAEDTGKPTIFINSIGTLEMSVANYPDYVVFDLDSVKPLATQTPLDPQQQFNRNREAALYVHQFLEKLGLESLVKTSGRTGLHVLVPIQRQYTYDQTRQFAQKVGQQLVDQHPQLFSMGWQLDNQARVSIDFHQNSRNKAFAAPFSLRATDTAAISMPLSWKTLEHLTSPQEFTLHHHLPTDSTPDSLNSLDQLQQPWPPTHPQELPQA